MLPTGPSKGTISSVIAAWDAVGNAASVTARSATNVPILFPIVDPRKAMFPQRYIRLTRVRGAT